jgi:hypothetical protein
MQQMGAMQSMGMQMGGQGQGMQMAQIGSTEEENPRAAYLAQLTSTLASLDENQEATLEKMLGQLYEGDDQNLVQTEDGEGENDDAQLAQLAHMLDDLEDDEFAQVTGKMEEMEEAEENDLAQFENDDNELELVQTNTEIEHRNNEFMTDTADFLMQADSETLDGLGQTLV